MIMTVEELKEFIKTTEPDKLLETKLQAIELMIREYTNNNFQKRAYRRTADIVSGLFVADTLIPFKAGDTIQISASKYNGGIYTIATVEDGIFTVNEEVMDESNVLVTKVDYPVDVKIGAAEILKWKLKNDAANSGSESQKEIQSETISRHSVTYVTDKTEEDIDEDFGVPKKHTAFLKHYKKARF